MRRTLAITVLLTFAAAALSGCLNGSSSTPAPTWQGRSADPAALQSGWAGPPVALAGALGPPPLSGLDVWPGLISSAPVVADIDGDGRDEAVAHSRDRSVHVWDVETGALVAQLQIKYPPSWHIDQVLNAPAVGVLRPGEPRSIVITTPAAQVIAWTHDPGSSVPGQMAFTKAFEVRTDDCRSSPGMDAGPLLVDLDGQPGLEILVQTEQEGFYALRSDGSQLWRQCWAGGNAAATAGDLDGDGDVEAVFASDGGFLSVLDGATGAPQWTFDIQAAPYNITPGSVTVAPTIAELDGQWPREIVFTARYAPEDDEALFPSFHMAVAAVRQNLTTWQPELVWMRQPEWANPLSYTSIVAVDVDADGRDDLFGMDWNTIGHNPGDWQLLESANAFRLAPDGSDVWVRAVETWWSNKAIAVVDADGDGEWEVLLNAPKGEHDGIWRLSAGDGAPEGFLTAHPWSLQSGPALSTAADGTLRVAVAAKLDGQGTHGVLVYDLGVPA